MALSGWCRTRRCPCCGGGGVAGDVRRGEGIQVQKGLAVSQRLRGVKLCSLFSFDLVSRTGVVASAGRRAAFALPSWRLSERRKNKKQSLSPRSRPLSLRSRP